MNGIRTEKTKQNSPLLVMAKRSHTRGWCFTMLRNSIQIDGMILVIRRKDRATDNPRGGRKKANYLHSQACMIFQQCYEDTRRQNIEKVLGNGFDQRKSRGRHLVPRPESDTNISDSIKKLLHLRIPSFFAGLGGHRDVNREGLALEIW
jgi:hypothetical protein